MGRPPAVVIVTRHGARLDAADKHWHLTSPAPYDSPLTYGGWTQCRSLGGKIASLLRARELLFQQTVKDSLDGIQAQSNGSDATHGRDMLRKRKKHRILIHSSPFLRCVQTSVAIAAGISQYRDFDGAHVDDHTTQTTQSVPRPAKVGQPKLASIQDEDEDSLTGQAKGNPNSVPYFKPRLRIDAFLGEWLSPEYYESITPPPNSIMMVATAKAELLQRGERIQMLDFDSNRTTIDQGNFPGGWGSRPGSASSQTSDADDLGKKLAETSLSHSNPAHRNRARTQGDATILQERASRAGPLPTRNGIGYVSPVPPYAVSPSEPIPAGYVQHARDACVDVDFQWDSMRAPQDWGDGGELGEEWSAMHKRFRKGLHSMVSWYALHHESALQSHGRSRVLHPHPQEPDDEDTDLVVVLVTHGAGCNALIGALTNQPVLLDVAMASLTMAVFREREDASEGPRTSYAPISPSLPRYANERPLSTDYTVTLTASTEHLTHNPFAPVSLKDLQTQPRIPTDASVVRRSSRRRFNPIPVVGHDRSASLSQLPTNVDAQPRWGIPRSDTGSIGGGSGSGGGGTWGSTGLPPRSVPDGMTTATTTTTTPTSSSSQPGLWSGRTSREGASHPRTWSLLSQGSNSSNSSSSAAGIVASPTGTTFPASGGLSLSGARIDWSRSSDVRGRLGSATRPEPDPLDSANPNANSNANASTGASGAHSNVPADAQTGADADADTVAVAVADPAAGDGFLAPLHRPTTIDSDEITERERGAKRRWTTSQRGLDR